MNVAYLKVTFGLCFHFIFSTPDCWCLFTGIVVHQLWSSMFSRKHEVWAPAAGASHFYFWATGMVPYANCVLCILVSFISHKPDPNHKGTLALDLKGAGAWSFLAVVFLTLRNAVCHGNRVDSDFSNFCLGLFIFISACEATSSFTTFNMSVLFMVKHLIFVISCIKSTNKVYTNCQ